MMRRIWSEDYLQSERRAQDLLKEVLPHALWEEYQAKRTVTVKGRWGRRYVIHPLRKTEELNHKGQRVGLWCLEERPGAWSLPEADRVLSRYLLLKANETRFRSVGQAWPETMPGTLWMMLRAFLFVAVLVVGASSGNMVAEAASFIGFSALGILLYRTWSR